LKIT